MASRNPFALLADDGDASDSEQKTLPKPVKPATVDAAPKNTKAGGITPAAPRRNVPGQTNTRPQKEANELPASDAPAGDKGQFEGERGRDDRGTGFGRGRGRGAARGGERGGERGRGGRGGRGGRTERPDRRSQTGRTDSEKAEHQGWGGDDGKRELEAENAGVTDAAAEKTEPATPVVAETDGAAVNGTATETEKAPETPAEPEDNSKTYEEFMKEQKAAGRGVLDNLSLQARKANEGSDDSQWKDGVQIKKGDNEEPLFGDLLKEKSSKARKERKEKTFLETEFQSGPRPGQDRERRGGMRGGRGGERGSAGRGRGEGRGRGGAAGGRGGRGGRGGAQGQANGINFSDDSAFPTLG